MDDNQQEPEAPARKGPFDEPDSFRSLAVIVENRKFFVPREILAAYSPVFQSMLYEEFAEAKKDETTLPEKNAEDIEELFGCLIPDPKTRPITINNVDRMLEFAEEYQIEELRG